MNARKSWILGIVVASLAMSVGCGSQVNRAPAPASKAPAVVQPKVVQPKVVQEPATTKQQPVQDIIQGVPATSNPPTTQSEPPVVTNEVSVPAADEVFVPKVRKPVSEMSDVELQQYLAELAFIASDT